MTTTKDSSQITSQTLLLTSVASNDTHAVLTPDRLWDAWKASVTLPVHEMPIEGYVAISNPGRTSAA